MLDQLAVSRQSVPVGPMSTSDKILYENVSDFPSFQAKQQPQTQMCLNAKLKGPEASGINFEGL